MLVRAGSSHCSHGRFPRFPRVTKPLNFLAGISAFTCPLLNVLIWCPRKDPRCQINPVTTPAPPVRLVQWPGGGGTGRLRGSRPLSPTAAGPWCWGQLVTACLESRPCKGSMVGGGGQRSGTGWAGDRGRGVGRTPQQSGQLVLGVIGHPSVTHSLLRVPVWALPQAFTAGPTGASAEGICETSRHHLRGSSPPSRAPRGLSSANQGGSRARHLPPGRALS